MQLTDTHAHLYLPEFQEDLETVLGNSRNLGIRYIFMPNIDSSTIGSLAKVCTDHSDVCFPLMGLHPCSVKEDFEKELELIKAQLDQGTYYGVGEIGIDLYWDKTFLPQQEKVFRRQIQWAKDMGLPIIIHARNSFDEIFHIVDELNDESLGGIFHCFSGSLEQAKKIIEYGGFKLGIGGVVTFKNAGLDKVVEQLDLGHLVLETDSPYLAPAPFRGKRNETPYLIHIAERIAQLKNTSIEQVAAITTANAAEIFNFEA